MTPSLDLGLFARRRVRLVRQVEMAECGLAALAMVANFHGLDTDLGTLRRQFAPSLRGADIRSLIAVADALGLGARAVKAPLDRLHQLSTPAILHWDMHHFVVLEAVQGGRARIHDPAGWSRWMPLAEVSDHFTGIALELQPLERFEPLKVRNTLSLHQLWSRMSGLKRAILQTLVLTVLMQVFVLASPYYMQIALDSALPALDRDLLTVLAVGFGLFAVFNAIASLLRGFVLLSAGATLGYGISSNVARRLFRLPIGWFEKRHVGDVLSRFQSVLPIRQFLTQDAVAAVLDGSLALLTLVLMVIYSPLLALVAVAAFTLYGLMRLTTFPAQRRAQEESMVAAAREQSTLIETVRGMVTLRLFNREAERHAMWQVRLNDAANAGIRFSRIGLWQTGAHTLIFGLETVLTVWLAVRMLIDGGFSTGMVFAYMAYRAQFLQKAVSLVDQGVAFRMLSLHLERLSDIALTPEDPSFAPAPSHGRVFTGALQLRGVGFRYGPNEPWVFRGVDLSVAPGEHVAIRGASGGGKSTLARILLGLVEPVEGAVFVDGVPLAEFGHKRLHDQISAVLQDDHLFAGTLAANIALFDDAPERAAVESAARFAQVNDDIERMPMGYETLVGDMGSALSGGQRQRLLLARALYRRPRLLLMDEATSHLDPEREAAVVSAIAGLGLSRITIAHRAETLRSADRVLHLENGVLREDSSGVARAVAPASR